MTGTRIVGRHAAGNFGGFVVQGIDRFLEPVFREDNACPAECVRFDDVGAGLQIVRVDLPDGCRACEDEIFVAAVVLLSAKIVRREVLALKMRACRAVKDDDFFFQYFGERSYHRSASYPELT